MDRQARRQLLREIDQMDIPDPDTSLFRDRVHALLEELVDDAVLPPEPSRLKHWMWVVKCMWQHDKIELLLTVCLLLMMLGAFLKIVQTIIQEALR